MKNGRVRPPTNIILCVQPPMETLVHLLLNRFFFNFQWVHSGRLTSQEHSKIAPRAQPPNARKNLSPTPWAYNAFKAGGGVRTFSGISSSSPSSLLSASPLSGACASSPFCAELGSPAASSDASRVGAFGVGAGRRLKVYHRTGISGISNDCSCPTQRVPATAAAAETQQR